MAQTTAFYKDEIEQKLKYINRTFMEPAAQSKPFLGKLTAKFGENAPVSFVDKLFSGKDTLITDVQVAAINTNLTGTILTRASNVSVYSVLTGQPDANVEFNLSRFIQASEFNDLRTELDNIRKLYSILDPDVYPTYVANNGSATFTGYTIAKYDLGATGTSAVFNVPDVATHNQIKALMMSYFNVDQFTATNIFAVRRLLLLYEAMTNFHIASAVHKRFTAITIGPTTEQQQPYEDLISYTYLYIKNLVRNVNTDISGENIVQIQQDLGDRARKFTDQMAAIDKLGDQVADARRTLRDDIEKLESSKKRVKETDRYLILAAWILGVTAVITALTYLLPINPAYKVTITGLTVLFTGITAWVVTATHPVESFATAAMSIRDLRSSLQLSEQISDREVFFRIMLDTVSDYLTDTINLAITFDAYRTYGSASFAMNKEMNKYTDAHVQIKNSDAQVMSTYGAVRLDQKITHSRMVYFLALAFIVSATALLVVKFPAQARVFYITGTVFVVLASLVYMFDTSGRVRTDGLKRYWGKPSTVNSL